MGLVDSFLQAYMATHQMQQQEKRQQQADIRQSVMDAIAQQRADTQDKRAQSYDDWIKERTTHDAALEEQKRQDALDRQKKTDADNEVAKQRAATGRVANANRALAGGAKKIDAYTGAEMIPSEYQPMLDASLKSQNAKIAQTNQGMPERNAGRLNFSQELPQVLQAFLGGYGQHLGQNIAQQVVPGQEQPQTPLTMADVENQQSPEYLRKQGLADARVGLIGSQQGLADAKAQEIAALEKGRMDVEAAHAKYLTAQTAHQDLINKEFPATLKFDHYIRNNQADAALINARANQLRAQIESRNSTMSATAKNEAQNASKFLGSQAKFFQSQYEDAQAAEKKAAENNALTGNKLAQYKQEAMTIESKMNADPDVNMKAAYLKQLMGVQQSMVGLQATWDANNAPLPGTITPDNPRGKNRIQLISEDREKAHQDLVNAMNAQGTINSLFMKQAKPSGGTRALPTAPATPSLNLGESATRRYLADKKTGQSSWYVVKNGQWVKE